MSPPSSPHFLTLLIFLLHISVQNSSQSDPTPFFFKCSGLRFNRSSPYETKLYRLITNLVVSTPKTPSFFSLTNSTATPQIIVLAQCRPDLSPSLCSACLNRSATELALSSCWLFRSTSIRSGNCLLRYTDQMFQNDPNLQQIYIENPQNSSDSFNRRVQDLMKTLIEKTAEAESRFAVGVSNEPADAVDIYGMGWCSIDLVSSDCAHCLKFVLERVIGKKNGFGAIVSCQVRFETYLFFARSLIATATSSAPAKAGGQWTDGTKKTVLVGILAAVALVLIFALLILLLRCRRNIKLTPLEIGDTKDGIIIDADIHVYDFNTLSIATDNFSEENKLGQGGFGPVYKGILKSGQEIAVKRLSKSSGQGLAELKNEVHFVAKLQHKNLVKLLGYCLEGDEKLLVYEYLPNGSLHKLLFSPVKTVHLNWKTRLTIIEGIGRGLLYLHEDSHLKIIHRDIKASNILLDGDMNAKISDFGLAKLFDVDETHKNTRRISGTYGYMAPEYALRGRFSTKSDVFSYGVLILEIITGRRNTSFQESDLAMGLPSYIWRCWNEGMGLKVVDQSLGDEYQLEVLRYIQIGLLCVQEDQALRPSMAMLVLTHSTNSIALTAPRRPAFYVQARANDAPASVNEMTISEMEAR